MIQKEYTRLLSEHERRNNRITQLEKELRREKIRTENLKEVITRLRFLGTLLELLFLKSVSPSTRVDRQTVDLNLKVLPFSTGVLDSQIFCNVNPLDINLPDSRFLILVFVEILNANFQNRPFGGRLALRGY